MAHERALAAIQLIAVMGDPSAGKGGVTAEAARELYDMENEILRDEVLGSRIQASLGQRADARASRSLYAAPMEDALKAALDLTDTDKDEADRRVRPLWFHLVAVASADAGLIEVDERWKRSGHQAEHHAAAEAYRTAKGRLRSQAFGSP